MGLQKSDEGIKNLQNNAEKCRKKVADKSKLFTFYFAFYKVFFSD